MLSGANSLADNSAAKAHNPDVLTCLANLSNDEVFTPPQMANRMLELLPAELWSDPNARFLDPVCKSGVFLREIAKRLDAGLEPHIPDRQARLNHIFKNQLYGIAITDLTALMSRRSVYCSKIANGPFSVCDAFDDEQGNIRFERTEHTWDGGRCTFCGASQEAYDRAEDLETHAYRFIHVSDPQELFDVKFDVVIGNPPYQLSDGGGTGKSATPVYQLFIEKAKELNPRYLCMIVPSRWFSGGKGLDEFRNEMLSDTRIQKLVDHTDSADCFSGVDIAGGVCYFLWNRDYEGICEVKNVQRGTVYTSERYLDEFDTFVRDSRSIGIIRKVRQSAESYLNSIVSSRKPFGLDSKVRPTSIGDLRLVSSAGEGFYSFSNVPSGHDNINKWKVLLSKASYDHAGQPDKEGKRRIFSKVESIPPGTICTESYLIVGSYETKTQVDNMAAYLKTKFCRFLVSTVLLTQNIAKDRFQFVPSLSMDTSWSDEILYKLYGLDESEVAFIESTIRPMEPSNDKSRPVKAILERKTKTHKREPVGV